MQLDRLNIGGLLHEHWQRKPLLIRNPWSAWHNPLDPDDLAGLACEEDNESRLVVRRGDGWVLEHGPFDAARFAGLGERGWTLLVQAVDHAAPPVAALLEAFRFIPNWRIDDVMVSYAADGGGVGPHFDNYDVFLVQGLGRRRWRVGARCDAATPLLPHDDLRLLANFEATDEWLLEPGDILYLPPGVAHDGVAEGGDCMTYSIGFRAPSRAELIAGWCGDIVEGLAEDDRYSDPALPAEANPGEIAAVALDRLHALVIERLGDRDAFARWFGRHSSTRKYPEIDWQPDQPITAEDVGEALASGAPLVRNPASRFTFVRQPAGLLLFVDGECFECADDTAAFAERLCAHDRLAADPSFARPATTDLIVALANQGSVTFDADDPCAPG